MYLTIVPSYGHDYKSKREVLAAWEAGKDFTICDMCHPDYGRQINKQDAEHTHGLTINIRYKGATQICVIRIK